MAKVTVLLAVSQRDFFGNPDIVSLAKEYLANSLYSKLCEFTVLASGVAAAEEVFDQSNNPSRGDDRMINYGNGRSLSMGDIVDVDGVKYLCDSFGWKVI